MTSEEISEYPAVKVKEIQLNDGQTLMDREAGLLDVVLWLKEIALQLAKLNERTNT